MVEHVSLQACLDVLHDAELGLGGQSLNIYLVRKLALNLSNNLLDLSMCACTVDNSVWRRLWLRIISTLSLSFDECDSCAQK